MNANKKSYIFLIFGALLISFSPVLIKDTGAPGTVTSFYRLLFGTITLEKWIIILITFFFLIHQIVYTAIHGTLQRIIPSRIRATVSSMNGFLVGILASVQFVMFGSIADSASYRAAFIVS